MKPLNLKETALKEEIKEILEELENMYEISELEEQVNNINKIRDYIINLQQENKKLKDNWNKLKEIIKKRFIAQGAFTSYEWNDLLNELLDKMKELQGSDSNVKN